MMILVKSTQEFLEITIPIKKGSAVLDTITIPAGAVIFDYSYDLVQLYVTIKFKLP